MVWYNIKQIIKSSFIYDVVYWRIYAIFFILERFLDLMFFNKQVYSIYILELIENAIVSFMVYILYTSYTKKPEHLWIIVIGLIGAGKSTACEECEKRDPNVNVYIEEPVGMWSEILKMFYASFSKTEKQTIYEPLLFQIVAFITRLFTIHKIYKKTKHSRRIYFVDSCVEVDRKVYAQSLIESGRIHGDQIQFYDLLYDLCGLIFPKSSNTKYIYLVTSIEKCIKNKEVRNRDAEKTAVDRSYLEGLKKRFDQFVDTIPKSDVYRVSGDKDSGQKLKQLNVSHPHKTS